MNKIPFKGNKDKKIALDKIYNKLKTKKEKNNVFVSGADELIKRIKDNLY